MLILEILISVGIITSSIIIIETVRRKMYKKMEKMGLKLAEELSEKLEFKREDVENIAECKTLLSLSRNKLTPKKNVNRLHTIENYKDGVSLNSIAKKYSRKLALIKNILLDEEYNPKIYPVDFIQPDWVRKIIFPDNSYVFDNRTYIQCFDEDTTEQFKSYFDSFYVAKKLSPFVGELNFNSEEKIKPFRVSCPDRIVYEKGMSLLINLVKEMQVYPITVKEYGNYRNECMITELNNIGELSKFTYELSGNLIKMEASRKPIYKPIVQTKFVNSDIEVKTEPSADAFESFNEIESEKQA